MGRLEQAQFVTSDISVGTILGERYEILSELGRGRVGIVYKANHRRLDKSLAVKVLFEEVGKDETSLKRFELEAKSSARLSHPHIINVLDFGLSHAGFPYLVMEYIEGVDLHNILTTEGRVPLARAVRIAGQVCWALNHAHNRGVIHRDLKPSNIMLMNVEGSPDHVKLVDFGIAKRYDATDDNVEKLTMEGQVLGTPAYMSPEQCQAGKLDARADIYSLGCVIFKMLTGNAPIAGSNIIEIIHNHISGEPLSFAAACPDVRIPPAIQEVVMTAMHKDPAQRHQSMAEFAALLQNALIASTSMPTPSTSFPAYNPAAGSVTGQTPALPSNNPLAGGNPFGSAPSPWGASGSFPALQPNQPSPFNIDPVNAPMPAAASPVQPVAAIAAAVVVDEQAAVYRARKLDTLMEAANQGDVRAQWELFCRFQSGDGVGHSSREEAQKWLRMAATSGHAEAQFRLGKRLLEGEGMLSSATAEGFVWIQKSADQGYEPALVLLAICYEEGRGTKVDIPKAVHYYRAAVQKGNQHAQPRLSACYQQLFEQGVEAEGFDEWIESRAIDGDVDALYLIACQLCRTSGGVRLSKQVLPHLLGPAQQGNVKAQQALAQVYFGGKAPDDAKQAYYWINKAAEAGNRDALVQLAGAFKNGTGVTRDPQRCVQLLQQAADSNHLDAQAILGTLMLIGDGIPRNLTRGITLLRNAATAGSTLAQWKFALCLKSGIGTVRDTREAEKWFDKAAEGKFDQGPPWQWTAPGLRFDEAIQTFHGLASIEHRQAHYWLGICFEHGLGVQRDRNKALEYYMKSANKGFQPAQEAAAKLKLAIT